MHVTRDVTFCALRALNKTMVATTKLFASTTSSSSGVRAKKNRRKITRKNPTIQFHTSSSQRLDNEEDGDTDMNLSTLAAGSSSLENEAEPTIITAIDDDEPMIDTDPTVISLDPSAFAFPPVAPGAEKTTLKSEMRRISMPPHRMTPLKKDWLNIFGPLTEILGLQVRMNVHRRCVEIRVCYFLSKSEKSSKI
jgi:RNA-binding protein PNO1